MPHNPYAHPQAAHRVARRTVIACEGRATETGYFEALRKHLRLPAEAMAVLGSKGTAPLTLVRAAVTERARRTQAGQFSEASGDQVWVVCDGDEHRQADPASWAKALEVARAERVHLAVSNPSFELWYLLHFQDQHAALTAHEATSRLKRHLPGYTKAAVLFPEPLLARTHAAIARARKLTAIAQAEGIDAFNNPSTGVATLVASLLNLF